MSLIDTRSLVDKVYEYLLNEIITGEIRYGDVLNIKQLAARLSISTMPVREAIKRLQQERIVEVRPRSGCLVRVPSRKMIMEVYELREVLELYALTKSIGHLDRERLSGLKRIVEQMQEVIRMKNLKAQEERARRLDLEFHREICRLADNDYLNHVFEQLILLVNMTLIHERTFHSLERKYYESHADIVTFLESKPEAAVEALRRHFRNVKDLIFGGTPEPVQEPMVQGPV